MMIFVLLALL